MDAQYPRLKGLAIIAILFNKMPDAPSHASGALLRSALRVAGTNEIDQ
jgi:hypothetical protein